MNALVERKTVETIVSTHEKTVAAFDIAAEKLIEAQDALSQAYTLQNELKPHTENYSYVSSEQARQFHKTLNLPNVEQYRRIARRLTSINTWSYLIEQTGLDRLMDTQAKEKLREQMAYVPERVDGNFQVINQKEIDKMLPEPTVDTILSTLENFACEADTIFKRGIANVFSSLDRRFRSHDGFKIGSRIILTRIFSDWGSFHYGKTRDILMDVERIFSILDGVTERDFKSGIRAIEESRSNGLGARQSECETEYFKIRGFMNGNAHLWFKRDDLVELVNKQLAAYYGEVIADGNQTEEDPFENIKTTPAKRFGFFPTPDKVAEQILEYAQLQIREGEAPLRILEPSAGTGNLAIRLAAPMKETKGYGADRSEYSYRHKVDCVEIQPNLAHDLNQTGLYNRVFCQDFLQLSPAVTGEYDRIIMNPPFDMQRDIDHVVHALKFLKNGGQLIAIMSAGTEFRQNKKAVAFRDLMKKMKASWRDLPAGSFSSVGTNVNTVYITVTKKA